MTLLTGDKKYNQSGFTLIEMMIVVGIILLISSMIVWNYSSQVKPERVRSAATQIKALLEGARSEAMRQQVFPYLLTQGASGYASGVSDLPRYWPFLLQVYSWDEENRTRYAVTVVAAKVSGSTVQPTPGDVDPNNHEADLFPITILPPGIVLKDIDGNKIIMNSTQRPVFWRGSAGSFVSGSVVGAENGLVISDEIDEDIKAILIIDPIYGSVTLDDQTK